MAPCSLSIRPSMRRTTPECHRAGHARLRGGGRACASALGSMVYAVSCVLPLQLLLVPGPVILWLQQAFRLRDNPALARALALARKTQGGMVVVHGLDPRHPLGSPRVNRFLMEAALETLGELEARGATVRELPASRRAPLADQVVAYAKESHATAIVADDPVAYLPAANLRRAAQLLGDAPISLVPVEANLVVPTRSYGRAAVGAYGIRAHILREARARLHETVPRVPMRLPRYHGPEPPGQRISGCRIDMYSRPTAHPDAADIGIASGERAARESLRAFLKTKLAHYGDRHDATRGGWHSDMSAHLHVGAISPRVVANAVLRAPASEATRAAFLEQLLVRRELSFNAARYLPTLRSLDVLPDWARATLAAHDADKREHTYVLAEWMKANTHDPLWNATQLELRHRGSIHSYMRMYWGKKIIEWSASHAEALSIMESLNGAWALDGRSAPMWANHLWCFGLHDRPFQERPVFGKVRWMSAGGTAHKFDVDAYIVWTDAGCPV